MEIEIPEGFKVNQGENLDWRITSNRMISPEISLNIGEEKEFDIILHWINNKDGMGIVNLKVNITDTANDANFSEIVKQDENNNKTIIKQYYC